MEWLLFLMYIITTLYWLGKKLHIIPDKPEAGQESQSIDVGHRYGLVEEQVKTENTSLVDFSLGGVVGVTSVWIFHAIIERAPSPEVSRDDLDCLAVPIGFLIGGLGAVVAKAQSKKWGLNVHPTVVRIFGGMVAVLLLEDQCYFGV